MVRLGCVEGYFFLKKLNSAYYIISLPNINNAVFEFAGHN